MGLASERAGQPLSIWEACCVYYNLCAPSVITQLSLDLWNLYRRINGTSNSDYESYWQLPALYVEACEVIESEMYSIRQCTEKEIVVKDLLRKR